MSEGDLGSIFENVNQQHREWFDLFEPWDIAERPDWLIDEAEKYGVMLDKGPIPFQTGALFSRARVTATVAGNRVGKSILQIVEIIIQLTGEIPISLRTPKGEVTKVLREHEDIRETKLNIARWGRFDRETGDFLDKDDTVKQDGTWHCGFIIGVGIYPTDKIPPGPDKIWLCCPKEVKEQNWIPQFKKLWPKRLRDDSRFEGGFSEQKSQFFSHNGCDLSFITYETGYKAVEGIEAWRIIFDEEPPDRRFWSGCILHAKSLTVQFTPIHGMTWAKRDIVDNADNPEANTKVFHCTGFDSPYIPMETTRERMAILNEWEIKPKVFGQFSAQTLEDPYFNTKALTSWIRKWHPRHTHSKIQASEIWDKPGDIINTRCSMFSAGDLTDEQAVSQGDVWEIYEEPYKEGIYYACIDTAMGDSDHEAGRSLDFSVCLIRRQKDKAYEKYDPVVAVLESHDRPIPFYRQVMPAMRLYNNCLMAPEVTGESNSIFLSQLIPEGGGAYPFILKMTVIQDSNRKMTEKRGWVNRGGKVRQEGFDLVDDFINDFGVSDDPNLPNLRLLTQMITTIRGKGGRPDHPKREHDDVLMTFVISEWVRNYAQNQIRDNWTEIEDDTKGERIDRMGPPESEKRPILGSRRGMDSRNKRLDARTRNSISLRS